jgi:hypothetical protein
VKKDGKKYKGLPAALKLAIQPQNGHAQAAATARANAARALAAAAK